MIFELYKSYDDEDNTSSYSYFPKDENYANKLKMLEKNSKLIFTYDAKSYFEAMQAMNDFFGYGEYKPEPNWEDTFFES